MKKTHISSLKGDKAVKPIVIFSIICCFFYASIVSAQEPNREQFFAQADIDQSGTLTKKEFKTLINLLAKSGHKRAKRVKRFFLFSVVWKIVDQNNDGFATREELASAREMNDQQEEEGLACGSKDFMGPCLPI